MATNENQQKLSAKFRRIKMHDLMLLILQIEIIQKQAGAELGKAWPNWGMTKLKFAESGYMVVLGFTFSKTHNFNP